MGRLECGPHLNPKPNLMGQANNRGNREDRIKKAQAALHQTEEARDHARRERQRLKNETFDALTPEQQEAYYTRQEQQSRRAMPLAALMVLAAISSW